MQPTVIQTMLQTILETTLQPQPNLPLPPPPSKQRNPQRMAELRDLCEVVTGAMSSIVQQRPQPPRASRSVNPAATAAAAAAAGPGHFHGSLTLASTALGPQDPATAAQQYFYLPNPHFFVSVKPHLFCNYSCFAIQQCILTLQLAIELSNSCLKFSIEKETSYHSDRWVLFLSFCFLFMYIGCKR